MTVDKRGLRTQRKPRRRKGLMMTGAAHAAQPGRPEVAAFGTPAAADFAKLDEAAALESAVRVRAGEALVQIISAASRADLYEALSTKTPVDTLIHIVSAEGAAAHAAAVVDDPLRAAKARAARRMTELLSAEGGPLGVEEVANLLRVSRAAVDKRRRTGTLIGVDDGGRAILYPGWQFSSTGSLPDLDDVLREIVIDDPWMRIEFFLSPDPELGERPLDALRSGRKAEVIAAASRFGRLGDDG
jgi:hypothetical protein